MQRWLISWNVFAVAISTLLALPKMYNIPTLTPTVIFWIHKLTYFFFCDIFHGIILPLNMRVPWDLGQPEVGDFYVRKPKIEPRRSPDEEARREFLSRRDKEMETSTRHLVELNRTFTHRRIREEEDVGAMDLYDVQPSTSFQLSQTVRTSGTSHSQSLLHPSSTSRRPSFSRFFKVKPPSRTPEPIPKVFTRETEFEGGGRRSTINYCRTCAKGKGRGKGQSHRKNINFEI